MLTHESFFVLCLVMVCKKIVWQIFFLKKLKNSVDKVICLWYYIHVAYDGNEKHKACGSGGTADALASGASGGDPVEVQILSTAPFKFQV